VTGDQPSADELLERLTLSRFAEQFSHLPYSTQSHILHCPSIAVRDLTNQGGFAHCGTCELVGFTAKISCEHAEVEFRYAQDGRLDWLIADLIEAAEAASP